jgi:hypothetical protein
VVAVAVGRTAADASAGTPVAARDTPDTVAARIAGTRHPAAAAANVPRVRSGLFMLVRLIAVVGT